MNISPGTSGSSSPVHNAAGLARRILVAIPAYNEEDTIQACLLSLGIQSPELREAIFVVGDGGSTDKTCEIVNSISSTNVSLLRNPRKLQSAAVNDIAASNYAQGRNILVRCDAHALYPDNYILRLAESLLAREAASVVVPMDSRGTTCFGRAAAWVVDTPLGSGGSAHRGGVKSGFIDHGHHAAFDLDWFRKIGGYDPTFSHNEDAEFDRRLTQAGGKIWLDADIRLTYFVRPNITALARQYRNYGRGRMRTLLKHRIKPRLRQALPVLLSVMLVVGTIGGFLIHPVLFLGPLAYLALLVAISLFMLDKHRSGCALWAAPALAAMHIAWAVGALEMLIFRRSI